MYMLRSAGTEQHLRTFPGLTFLNIIPLLNILLDEGEILDDLKAMHKGKSFMRKLTGLSTLLLRYAIIS